MRYLVITLLIISGISESYAQGCSDAGFCSMGAMRPSQVYTKRLNFKLRALEFSYYNGKTTLSPKVSVATLDFTFGINEKTNFQVKVPYQWVKGNFGNTSGLADLSLSLTRNVYNTEKYHVNATLGVKIPTNHADLDETTKSEFLSDGVTSADLPMYYQVSLGTFDLVLGGSLITKEWMFAAGLQKPLSQNNENEFRHSEWANYHSQDYLLENPEATHLKRGTDIMVRAERAFHFSNLDLRLGVLPIYRISKDQILNMNTGEYEKHEGTTGLALTALFHVAYHFNTKHTVKLMYGKKFTDREFNPDGLTRKHVVTMSYVITF